MTQTATSGARYEQVSPPAEPPIPLDKVQRRLGLEDEQYTALLNDLQFQCLDELEAYAGLSLGLQTRRISWDSLATDRLLYGPVIEAEEAPEGLSVGTGINARVSGDFPDGCTLVYRAGYETMPERWQGVLLSMIRERFESQTGMTLPGTPQPSEYWKTMAARLRPVNPFS